MTFPNYIFRMSLDCVLVQDWNTDLLFKRNLNKASLNSAPLKIKKQAANSRQQVSELPSRCYSRIPDFQSNPHKVSSPRTRAERPILTSPYKLEKSKNAQERCLRNSTLFGTRNSICTLTTPLFRFPDDSTDSFQRVPQFFRQDQSQSLGRG